MALEEQIASRKLQHADNNVPAPPVLDQAAPPLERIMGQRHGGPMAAPRKDCYASDLRAQIEARNARRAAEEEAGKGRVLGADAQQGLFGPGGVEAPALGCRRRHGAPPLPTKESYAMALQQQMEMRSVEQAAEASRLRELTSCEEDTLDEGLMGKGRRHGPVVPPAKSDYAAELLQQMAVRKAKQTVDAEFPRNGFPGGNGAFSVGEREQVEPVRGRRPPLPIDTVSGHRAALQEQMAERAAQRAANAFHAQAQLEADVAMPIGQDDTPKAGRRKLDLPAKDKKSYALALQEQIAERKAQQESEKNAGAAKGSFIGGDASDMGPMRGRRHPGQMVPASKQEYKLELQKQMAERECKQAAMKFHAQPPWFSALKDAPGADQDVLEHGGAGHRADSLDRLLGANADHVACSY